MMPYGRQDISEEDIRAVEDVLRSDWLTQGPAIDLFERTVSEYCGSSYAVAVSSATAALHLSCRALGLGQGDSLWTSPNTFVASANCALYCGASVDFVDIDTRTYNLSVDALKAKLQEAERNGRLPKIVMPVHFAGQSCEMREIRALADQYGFSIIEDASHAIGGDYLGERIGNCRYSDIAVFSFHPVKIVTTGEGGMAVTNHVELAERMRSLRSHGINRDETRMKPPADGPWYYQQTDLGYNYRMTDIQAALGASQMNRLEKFVIRRRELVERYRKLLAESALTLPVQHLDSKSAHHLYVVQVDEGSDRRRLVFGAMREAGIGVNVHYIPVHIQPYYQRLGFQKGDFPNAESYYSRALTLPLFPGLSDEMQDQVCMTLKALINR